MRIKTPHELGLRFREAREDAALTQSDLAEMVGTSRQWIFDLERGKPNLRLGLVLKALSVLGLACHIGYATTGGGEGGTGTSLSEVLNRARRESI